MAERSDYHHGALRLALLEAARSALRADPGHDPSLRAMADAIGVSATAPYAHFPDKDTILAAVAKTGFDDLAVRLRAAAGAGDDARQDVARTYLEFAADEPGLYRLMFATRLDNRRFADLAASQRQAFAAITETYLDDPFPERSAMRLWGTLHGFAQLLAVDCLPDAQSDPALLAELAVSG